MQLQKEFDEMTDTDNNPFGRFTPDPNSANKNRLIKEHLIFTEIPEPASNRIAQFNDLNSPLSMGLQAAPWPSKYKPVSVPKFNGFGNSRQFFISYEATIASAGGDDVALAKSFIISCEGPILN
jgi:hypothetical protein